MKRTERDRKNVNLKFIIYKNIICNSFFFGLFSLKLFVPSLYSLLIQVLFCQYKYYTCALKQLSYLLKGEGFFAVFDRITFFFSKHASAAEKVAKE